MTPDERVQAVVDRVLAKLDRTRLAEIAARYEVATSGPSATKYLDAERWIRVCARRAVALDLDRCEPLRVLDLGTGAGYFPLVCRRLGHYVAATDWSGREVLYREVTEAIGVDVSDLDVRPGAPLLPHPTPGGYELITAFMVTFNGHVENPWGVDEWAFFLDDALARLSSGGRLVLELNREPDGACYSPEAEALFRDRGAMFTRRWPATPCAGGHRVVFVNRPS